MILTSNLNLKGNSRHLIFFCIFIIVTGLVYYYYTKDNKEGFQTEKGEKEDNKVYFNQSIQYHQMEKTSQISNNKEYISFWNRKPNPELGYLPLSTVVLKKKEEIVNPQDISMIQNMGLQLLAKNGKNPLDFIMIWKSQGSKALPSHPISIWKIIPPEGHVGLGDVVVNGFDKPKKEEFTCLPLELVEKDSSEFTNQEALYQEEGLSIWGIGSYGFFMATHMKDKPLERTEEIYKIKEDALNSLELDPLEKNIKLKIIARS